jgi:hypothetical protein
VQVLAPPLIAATALKKVVLSSPSQSPIDVLVLQSAQGIDVIEATQVSGPPLIAGTTENVVVREPSEALQAPVVVSV